MELENEHIHTSLYMFEITSYTLITSYIVIPELKHVAVCFIRIHALVFTFGIIIPQTVSINDVNT